MSADVNVSARVRMKAAEEGISLAEVAKRMDTSPQALSALLKTNNPKATHLAKIADALGVTVEYLLSPVSPTEYGAAMLKAI